MTPKDAARTVLLERLVEISDQEDSIDLDLEIMCREMSWTPHKKLLARNQYRKELLRIYQRLAAKVPGLDASMGEYKLAEML